MEVATQKAGHESEVCIAAEAGPWLELLCDWLSEKNPVSRHTTFECVTGEPAELVLATELHLNSAAKRCLTLSCNGASASVVVPNGLASKIAADCQAL